MLNLKEAVLKAVPVLVEIAAPAVVEMEQEEEESTPQPGEEEGRAPRHTRQALRQALLVRQEQPALLQALLQWRWHWAMN